VDVSSGEVLVRRWDDATETFAQGCGMSGAAPRPPRALRRRFVQRQLACVLQPNWRCVHAADEAARASAAVQQGHYDHGLGPYPQGVEAQWRQLCRHVTAHTLERVGVPTGTRVVPGDAEAEDAPVATLTPFFTGLARAPRFSPAAARRLAGMTAAEVRTSGGQRAFRSA
jgi:hypothetical protein